MKAIARLLTCSLLLASTPLLTGCLATAAVVATGATAGGVVATDPRDSKTVFNDQNISYQIQKKAAGNPGLNKISNIDVATYNGVVLLAGQTPTTDLREQAVQLAQTVPGVKMIYNEITIGIPVSASTHTNDTWITTKARSNLLMTQGWSSNDFKVVTEDGVVYLMGIVDPLQAQLAQQNVSKITGVKKVVTLLDTNPPKKSAPEKPTNTSTNSGS